MKPGAVVHVCNFCTQEVDGGRSEAQDHPWLHGEFEHILSYTKPRLKNHSGGNSGAKGNIALYLTIFLTSFKPLVMCDLLSMRRCSVGKVLVSQARGPAFGGAAEHSHKNQGMGVRSFMGLESWLRDSEHLLLLQRRRVQFPTQ